MSHLNFYNYNILRLIIYDRRDMILTLLYKIYIAPEARRCAFFDLSRYIITIYDRVCGFDGEFVEQNTNNTYYT